MRPVTRTPATALALACLVALPLAAQTPTPTPTATATATATATPTPTSVILTGGAAYYSIPAGGRYDCSNIVLDDDGSIWTGSANENVVVKLSADGKKVTRWKFPTDAAPSSLLKDSDGTFWITELGGFKIARLNPATNALTEWQDNARRPSSLAKRSDGSFWLPETGGLLTKFDPPTGTLSYYRATGIFSLSYPLLMPDGTLYAADFLAGSIVKFTADGSKATKWPLPSSLAVSSPSKIIVGPDGALWISLYASGELARFDPQTNELKTFLLSSGTLPFDLKLYRGRIVFSEQGSGYIGFFDPTDAVPNVTATLVPEEIATVLQVTETASPQTTTLEVTTEDLAAPSYAPVGGIGVGPTAVIGAGTGSVYGIAVDLRRARIYFGTQSGNIGALGPPLAVTGDQVFPTAASIAGVNGVRWATQVVSWNRGTPDTAGARKSIALTELLLPSGWISGVSAGAGPVVEAGKMLGQTDVLATDLKAPDTFGALRLIPDVNPDDLFSWQRVYLTRADGGTYGFARNPAKQAQGIAAGEKGFFFLPPVPGQRVNGGLLVIQAAIGTISIVDSQGVPRGTPKAFDWPPGYHVQYSTIFSGLGVEPIANGRVVFSVTEGRIMPFGTSIDPVSSDPMNLDVFGPTSAGTLQWILGFSGPGGPLGRASASQLQLFNGGTDDASVTLYYLPSRTAPATGVGEVLTVGASIPVPAGKTVFLPDLGREGTNGVLVIESDKPVYAYARMSASAQEGGSFGFGFAGVRGGDAVAPGSRGVFLATTDNGYDVIESTLQLTNPTDAPATVTLNFTEADGVAAGTRDVTLQPKEVRSIPTVWYSTIGYGSDFGRLDVVPATDSAVVFATLLRRDNKTGDVDAVLPHLMAK